MSASGVAMLTTILRQRAQHLGWDWSESPNALLQKSFKRHTPSPEFGDDERDTNLIPFDEETPAPGTPAPVSALMGVAAILIGSLGEDLDRPRPEAANAVKYYHLQMARARTWLENKYKENMYLLLVTPPGAGTRSSWLDFAHEIERNEYICRKLVWRPTLDQKARLADANYFCDRMFPILPAPGVIAASNDIDPLAKALGDGPFPATWLGILVHAREGGETLATKLINALKEQEKK